MKRAARLFYNASLKWKLLLSYALVVLIPLTLWGIYSYQQVNSTLQQRARASFQDICSNTAANFNSRLQRIENAFSAAAGDASISQIINGDYQNNNYQKYYDITQRFDPTFNALRMLNPEIRNVHIFTNGSIKGARQNFHDLQASLEECEWLSQVNSVEMTWLVQDGSLYVGRQVFDVNHLSRSSIVLLELDRDAVLEGGLPQEQQNCGLLLQDSGGEVLLRWDQMEPAFGQEAMDAAQLEQAAARQGFLFHRQTLHNGWALCLYMDMNAMLMPPQTAFQPVFLQLALSVLLLAGMIILFSRTMVRRIERLNAYLARVVKGSFQEDISSPDQDEIGVITNNVGMMVRETRALIDEVNRSHNQQREAEIKALQAQINPHFLYNTLSAINWQAIQSGNQEISKIATSLSAFYRSILNRGQSVVTVQQELETTRSYLEIQQATHGGSFDVEYVVEGDVLEYYMPGIILQPVVENAIEHGIDRKRDGERGKIRIEARMDGLDIVFQVCDNGPGIRESEAQEALAGRGGYGVKNVNERLKLFFDGRYGLSFLHAGEAGTRAVIRIPQHIEFNT